MNGNDGRPWDRDRCGNGMKAGMGEPHNDGRIPDRRRVHPGDAVTGPEGAALEALLAALPQAAAHTEGELRAVAAFDAGAHRARTRRRDEAAARAAAGSRQVWSGAPQFLRAKTAPAVLLAGPPVADVPDTNIRLPSLLGGQLRLGFIAEPP